MTPRLNLLLAVAEEMPAGTILHFDKSLLIQIAFQWINVLFLTAVLVFILYKPVRKFMADRTARIKGEIDAARETREEAEELRERYEQMIAGIEKEREKILRETHKHTMEKSDHLLFEARREADAMYARALAELELERKNMTDEMKRQIIEISVLMAGRFVEVSMDRATQDKYIDQALAEWEGG